MLYREIMAVCSEIHIKQINTLCGLNVELLNVTLVVHNDQWAIKVICILLYERYKPTQRPFISAEQIILMMDAMVT